MKWPFRSLVVSRVAPRVILLSSRSVSRLIACVLEILRTFGDQGYNFMKFWCGFHTLYDMRYLNGHARAHGCFLVSARDALWPPEYEEPA